jgi:ketosteroid isomerase-like protein
VTRLVVERLNAGDAAGAAALYEPEVVLAYRADRPTTGRAAIQAVYSGWSTPGCGSASRRRRRPSGSRTWR